MPVSAPISPLRDDVFDLDIREAVSDPATGAAPQTFDTCMTCGITCQSCETACTLIGCQETIIC